MNEILVIQASLNPKSKSAAFGNYIEHKLSNETQTNCTSIKLRELTLPFCDGGQAYGHENVAIAKAALEKCSGVFISAPVYNYDFNSALKNFIELTGQSWANKVVAIACYAGGERSYMSPMSTINSLMLDFRCIVLPNFVYRSDKSADTDEEIHQRLDTLSNTLLSLSSWNSSRLVGN